MNVNRAGQTHDQLQSVCFKRACREYYPYLYRHLICIPNDMHAGNVARWKQYEALGVTPGVWDMQLNWFWAVSVDDASYETGEGWHIIPATHWFEFKVGADDLSDNQKKFRDRMSPLGHKFYIATEEDEFMEQMKLIVEPGLHIAKEIYKGVNY